MEPHRLTIEQIYRDLETSARGLSAEQVLVRQARHGPNRLPEPKRRSLFLTFAANLYNALALLLWIGGILAYVAGMPVLGHAIFVVIIVNALFSFLQEYKAEKATTALKQLLPRHAKVLRDGEIENVLADEVVPGDIMVLEEGDHISADGRLCDAFDLKTINAAFTGESAPVRRTVDPVLGGDVHITQSPNLVFAGTSVASGAGRAVVYATGQHTEFGKIAQLTGAITTELSPLEKEIAKAARVVTLIATAFGIVLFVVAIFMTNLTITEGMLFAIGIIVANVPEGLLPTLSLALAMGVQRMARRHALVKKLSSVETLGSTTVICTDKTGTLTQNEMTVREIWADGTVIEVGGVGYEPSGSFVRSGQPLSSGELRQFDLLWRAAAFCNTARLVPPPDRMEEVSRVRAMAQEQSAGQGGGKTWTIIGDPTEGALAVVARKAGLDLDGDLRQHRRIFLLPFDSVRKRMSSIHAGQPEGPIAYVKGAPREMLGLCSHIRLAGGDQLLDEVMRRRVMAANDDFARRGLRVLALACRTLEPQDSYTVEKVEEQMLFLGLAAMQDPPRPEVEEAVKRARQAGIRIVMITGDYGLTAESIARKIGIVVGENPRIVTGAELESMTKAELDAVLYGGEVIFARVAPEHKLKIVTTFKAHGEIVAVTGDGVNDAPALKRADIGVAMGITGTDVAKEAAEMILTDDNFASIVAAIEEGRSVFDNIKKFVTYIFAHLTPEAVPFILFVISGGTIPMGITVLQILAIDLGTETLPALALGVEKAEPGIMTRPPRRKGEGIIDRELLFRAYIFMGLIESVLIMGGYFFVLYRGGWQWGMADISSPTSPMYSLYLSATTMTFLGIIGTQVGTVFACRTSNSPVLAIGLFSNRWLLWGIVFELVLVAAVIYVPPLQAIFGTTSVGLLEWGLAFVFGVIIFAADEIRKAWVKEGNARR